MEEKIMTKRQQNKKFSAVQAISNAKHRSITPELPRPDGRAENLVRVERPRATGY
jgi:hypothetical protein